MSMITLFNRWKPCGWRLLDIHFEVCTSEAHAMTDQEILDSVLSDDYAEEEEEKTMCLPKSQNIWDYRRYRLGWMLVFFWQQWR